MTAIFLLVIMDPSVLIHSSLLKEGCWQRRSEIYLFKAGGDRPAAAKKTWHKQPGRMFSVFARLLIGQTCAVSRICCGPAPFIATVWLKLEGEGRESYTLKAKWKKKSQIVVNNKQPAWCRVHRCNDSHNEIPRSICSFFWTAEKVSDEIQILDQPATYYIIHFVSWCCFFITITEGNKDLTLFAMFYIKA